MAASDELYISGIETTGETLSKGYFGIDYKVLLYQTPCSAKKIRKKFLPDEKALRKFLRVCQLWCSLRHPHVHQFLGLWNSSSFPVPLVVTEKMDCHLSTLLTILPKESFSFRRKLEILYQVALALAFLHGRDPATIHGDLTPESVLVDIPSDRTKITDVGMATVCGTSVAYGNTARGKSTPCARESQKSVSDSLFSTTNDVRYYGFLTLHTLTHTPPTAPLSTITLTGDLLDDAIRKQYYAILTQDETELVSRVVVKCLRHDAMIASALALEMRTIVECTRDHSTGKKRGDTKTGSVDIPTGSHHTPIPVQHAKSKVGNRTKGSKKTATLSEPCCDLDSYVNISISSVPDSVQLGDVSPGLLSSGGGSINSEDNELIRRIIEIEENEDIVPNLLTEGEDESTGRGETSASLKQSDNLIEEIFSL